MGFWSNPISLPRTSVLLGQLRHRKFTPPITFTPESLGYDVSEYKTDRPPDGFLYLCRHEFTPVISNLKRCFTPHGNASLFRHENLHLSGINAAPYHKEAWVSVRIAPRILILGPKMDEWLDLCLGAFALIPPPGPTPVPILHEAGWYCNRIQTPIARCNHCTYQLLY